MSADIEKIKKLCVRAEEGIGPITMAITVLPQVLNENELLKQTLSDLLDACDNLLDWAPESFTKIEIKSREVLSKVKP